jgi:hypothetical protein
VIFIHSDAVHVNVRTDDRDPQGRLIRGGNRRLFADFERGAAPEWAQQQGVQTFGMSNRPEEISAERWLACYDSVAAQAARGWSDDERKLIEDRLVELGYMQVERPKIQAPYERYDQHRKVHGQRKVEHAIKDIVAAYESAGFDLDHAIQYEMQEENNPQVLAALEALKADGVKEDEAEPLISA